MDLYIYIIVHKLVLELITYCCLPPPPACMLMIMLSMLSRLALLSPCLEFSCAVVNLFPCSRILRLPILGSVALFCSPRAPRFELRFAEETPVSDCNYDYNKTTTTTTTPSATVTTTTTTTTSTITTPSATTCKPLVRRFFC